MIFLGIRKLDIYEGDQKLLMKRNTDSFFIMYVFVGVRRIYPELFILSMANTGREPSHIPSLRTVFDQVSGTYVGMLLSRVQLCSNIDFMLGTLRVFLWRTKLFCLQEGK